MSVGLDADATTLTLVVDGTGVGIDAAFMPCLFDAFKHGSSGDARAFEGTGLGLIITKQLVDLMGGTITVDSTKGDGTTFTVELPRTAPSPAAEA